MFCVHVCVCVCGRANMFIIKAAMSPEAYLVVFFYLSLVILEMKGSDEINN